MRDKIKDENYFITLVEREERNIMMFESAVKRSILKKGELDRGTRNGYSILINSYQKKINLLYSLGEDIEVIEKCYKKLLFYYGKMWDRKYGYIELIRVLSMAVLLGVDKVELLELEEKLISENFNDYLVNILINKIDSSWEKESMGYEFQGIYDCLEPILSSSGRNACEVLEEYLQEKWYELHKECPWYDSHKSDKSVYYGYWSYEAGAVAKILNLDDESLKNVPYYPYDLVHYKNNL